MRRLPASRVRAAARRLAADTRALALVEFAFALPILLTIGMFGVEEANIALVNQRVDQYALTLADNASRVGTSSLTTQQLREVDINDVLQGTRLQGAPVKLTTYGRVTLSSLERNSSGGQWIHWQRCMGLKASAGYDSTYGTAGTGATGTAFVGMGDAGSEVKAPPNSGVMFVEINYDYQPLFLNILPVRKLHYSHSFIVRDRRDFVGPVGGDGVYNPAPAAPVSSCSLHAT